MDKPMFEGEQYGLSEEIANSQLPITIETNGNYTEGPNTEAGLSTFGQIVEFFSLPFRDPTIFSNEYDLLNVEEKRKRDVAMGYWLPGVVRTDPHESGREQFFVSYFVFDIECFLSDERGQIANVCNATEPLAYLAHPLRSHTLEKPKIRLVFPLSHPVPHYEALLLQPEFSVILRNFGVAGQIVGEAFSEVDRRLELWTVSEDEGHWMDAADGAPICVESISNLISNAALNTRAFTIPAE